jgi:hypothetical protein
MHHNVLESNCHKNKILLHVCLFSNKGIHIERIASLQNYICRNKICQDLYMLLLWISHCERMGVWNFSVYEAGHRGEQSKQVIGLEPCK